MRATSGGATLEELRYDEASNRTTARLVVAKGSGLLILRFTQTQGGLRSLRLVRAGYSPNTGQIFTNEFLRSFRAFRHLRYMDVTETNSSTPSSDPRDFLEWRDKKLPSDATQQEAGRKVDAAWEFVTLLANQTGTAPGSTSPWPLPKITAGSWRACSARV